MGSRLALPLLLLAALIASVLFGRLSSREPSARSGSATTMREPAAERDSPPAELAPPTTVDPTPAQALDRTVVDEPDVARANRSKLGVEAGPP